MKGRPSLGITRSARARFRLCAVAGAACLCACRAPAKIERTPEEWDRIERRQVSGRYDDVCRAVVNALLDEGYEVRPPPDRKPGEPGGRFWAQRSSGQFFEPWVEVRVSEQSGSRSAVMFSERIGYDDNRRTTESMVDDFVAAVNRRLAGPVVDGAQRPAEN